MFKELKEIVWGTGSAKSQCTETEKTLDTSYNPKTLSSEELNAISERRGATVRRIASLGTIQDPVKRDEEIAQIVRQLKEKIR